MESTCHPWKSNPCKPSTRVSSKGWSSGKSWQAKTAGQAWLVYGGDTRQIRFDATVLPWYETDAEQIVK
jgi:hypothetical protein